VTVEYREGYLVETSRGTENFSEIFLLSPIGYDYAKMHKGGGGKSNRYEGRKKEKCTILGQVF